MSFLDRFRKRTEDEASRIARLSKTGRMVDGKIIDVGHSLPRQSQAREGRGITCVASDLVLDEQRPFAALLLAPFVG